MRILRPLVKGPLVMMIVIVLASFSVRAHRSLLEPSLPTWEVAFLTTRTPPPQAEGPSPNMK